MLSDEAFLYLTIFLFIFAVIYWIGLLVYIFYDDLVEVLTTKTKSYKIVEDEPVFDPKNFKLRKPIK